MDKEITTLPHHQILRNEKSRFTINFSNPYITAATSRNTRRAYQSDIRNFESWGGTLPTQVDTILKYLQAFAKTLNPRTLSRRPLH